jgi:hypothetical protein
MRLRQRRDGRGIGRDGIADDGDDRRGIGDLDAVRRQPQPIKQARPVLAGWEGGVREVKEKRSYGASGEDNATIVAPAVGLFRVPAPGLHPIRGLPDSN